MKRSEIRTFIKTGVNSLTPTPDYWDGLLTDWNAQRSNTYPGVLLMLEETDTDITISAPNDDFAITLLICNIDKLDSTPDQYESIVDACDEMAQRLVYKYRNIISGYKMLSMENVKRKKFVKKYADCLTGVELTFSLKGQYKTNV
jgi:hypothetical protein